MVDDLVLISLRRFYDVGDLPDINWPFFEVICGRYVFKIQVKNWNTR